MTEFTDYLENALLDHVFGGTTFTQPTSIEMGLSTTVISDDGTGVTEPVGNGYARETVTFAAASGGSKANSADVDFVATGDWGTIVATIFYDQTTNLLCYDNDFIDTPVDSDTLSFVATTGIIISID